jgi:hypothetical protein
MGWIAPVLAIAGTAMSARGQQQAGEQAARSYETNAKIAQIEADYAIRRGEFELARHREDVEKLMGRQAVIGGASGLTASPDIAHATAKGAAMDEAMIRYGANIDAWRAATQSRNLSSQAGYFREAGYLGAGATILNTASAWDWRKTGGSRRYGYPTTRDYYGGSPSLRGNP